MVSNLEYGMLAARVYGDSTRVRSEQNTLQLPSGWNPISSQTLADGFMASSYEDSQGNVVISYAGTTNENSLDWVTGNIPGAIGAELALQVLDAAKFYLDAVGSGLNPNRITFTGHSLGGGLASLMAVFFNSSATVFDEAPFLLSATSPIVYAQLCVALVAEGYVLPPSLTSYRPLTDEPARQANVSQIYVTGEALSTIPALDALKIMGGNPTQLNPMTSGENLVLPSTDWAPASADLHSIVLLNSFQIDPAFLTAVQHHPEFLSRIFDGLFKNILPTDRTATLLDLLVQRQVAGEGSLTALTVDLNEIDANAGLTGVTQIKHPGGLPYAVNVAAVMDDVELASLYAQGSNRSPQQSGLPPFNTVFSQVTGGLEFDTSKFGIQTSALDGELARLLQYLTPRFSFLGIGNGSALSDRDVQSVLSNSNFIVQSGTSPLNYDGSQDTKSDVIVGYGGNDALVGGASNDILVGGDGDDSLTGGAGDDTLIGGAGNDSYIFSDAFGKDKIFDSDGIGSIALDGITLASANAAGANIWVSSDDSSGKHIGFAIYNDPSSLTGKDLVITRSDGTDNTITIEDFDLSAAESATGYLGMHLKSIPGVWRRSAFAEKRTYATR